MAESQYAALGVDAGKESVRKAFENHIDNDFPGAFVNIVFDPDHPGEAFTGHMDGDGSKFIQRVLMYREGGCSDPSIFRGAADDALSMNTGDIAAAGFVSGVLTVTDILNVNGFSVPKQEIMEQIGGRLSELIELYRRYGFKIYFLGGETADLSHQVRTTAFDVNVHARAKAEDLITGNVQLGDVIWGFASDGQAAWETEPNSGLMSNGLTLARMCLMDSRYTEKYPDLVMPGKEYYGDFSYGDTPSVLGGMSVGQALVSPTRQWAILIKILVDKLKAHDSLHLLHGITMNTGGGATKVLHLGQGGIRYHKVMPRPPRIFSLIQSESGESWQDMYRNFNCGIGIDVIGSVELSSFIREVSAETRVQLYELGICTRCCWQDKNKVTLEETPFGSFSYE